MKDIERFDMLVAKQDFVNEFAKTMVKANCGVEDLQYVALLTVDNKICAEYVKIVYNGGFKTYKCVSCDSEFAIMQDVIKAIDNDERKTLDVNEISNRGLVIFGKIM